MDTATPTPEAKPKPKPKKCPNPTGRGGKGARVGPGSGRPSTMTQEHLDDIVRFGEAGRTVVQFCAKHRIHPDTVYHWVATKPKFAEAFSHGRLLYEAHWDEQAAQAAESGGAHQFLKYYTGVKLGWRDTSSIDVTSAGQPIGLPLVLGAAGATDEPSGEV